MTSTSSAWTLRGTLAELCTGKLSGRVDVARPEHGLHEVDLEGRKLGGQLFAVGRDDDKQGTAVARTDGAPAWPLQLADVYLRGNDLVAGYAPRDDWPYSPQIYWRAGTLQSIEGLRGSLSLLVSVQTHLLDTWPRIVIESNLACHEVLRVSVSGGKAIGTAALGRAELIRPAPGECCVVRRLADVAMSYVEIMPGSDFRDVAIRHDGGDKCRVSWGLFADFLEKGVIRRSRLYSAFVAQEKDVELAAACCALVAHSALPLTT